MLKGERPAPVTDGKMPAEQGLSEARRNAIPRVPEQHDRLGALDLGLLRLQRRPRMATFPPG